MIITTAGRRALINY